MQSSGSALLILFNDGWRSLSKRATAQQAKVSLILSVPIEPLAESIKTMNKFPFEDSHNADDEPSAEYHFDYSKANPNRFAIRDEKPPLKVVTLDADVAQIFTTSESVNRVLRALIQSMPQTTNGEIV
jgi:hypothetical protein